MVTPDAARPVTPVAHLDGPRLAPTPAETDTIPAPTQIQEGISLGTPILGMAVSPDAQSLAVATQDGVYLIDKASWQVVWRSGFSQDNNAVAFSADGRILAATSDTGRITLWETGHADPLRVLIGPSGSAGGAAFSPDGQTFAAGFFRSVQFWDMRRWMKTTALGGHNNVIWRLAYSSDGQTLASASTDQTILLWDLTRKTPHPDLTPYLTLRSPTYWLRSAAFSPDGRTIAAGSGDGVVYIWNIGDGQRLSTLKGGQGFIWDVAFDAEGNRLAAASEDGSVVLWDLRDDEMLLKWQAASPVHAILCDPDTGRIIAGLADGNIQTILQP